MKCPACRGGARIQPIAIVNPTIRIKREWPEAPLEISFTNGAIRLYRCTACPLTFLDPDDEKALRLAAREAARRGRERQEASVVVALETLRRMIESRRET